MRRNRRLLCLLQQPQHHLGCFHLRQPALLCPVGTGIYLPGGGSKTVLRILGGKKRVADRQECISIRPAESEHAEPVGELLFCVVIKARQELDLLGAGAMVDGVIKDEDIDTGCAGERFKGGFYDGGSEHCCESAPMDVAGIHEAVEGVLGKGDRTGLQAHLHEEGALREGGGKGDEKDAENREASELVGVCRAKKTSDMVTAEKRLHFLGKLFLRLVGLCYTVHGMSLHWMFFLVVKLYQMDVAHAILLCGKTDFSRLAADYFSAKFEI